MVVFGAVMMYCYVLFSWWFETASWKYLSVAFLEGVEDEGGYSYDASDGWGRSPLHEAVELGHLKVVETWHDLVWRDCTVPIIELGWDWNKICYIFA